MNEQDLEMIADKVAERVVEELEPTYGYWIAIPPYTHHQPKEDMCSKCGRTVLRMIEKYAFCPHCGKRMSRDVLRKI